MLNKIKALIATILKRGKEEKKTITAEDFIKQHTDANEVISMLASKGVIAIIKNKKQACIALAKASLDPRIAEANMVKALMTNGEFNIARELMGTVHEIDSRDGAVIVQLDKLRSEFGITEDFIKAGLNKI